MMCRNVTQSRSKKKEPSASGCTGGFSLQHAARREKRSRQRSFDGGARRVWAGDAGMGDRIGG